MVIEQVDNDVTTGEDTNVRENGREDGEVKPEQIMTQIRVLDDRQGLQVCSVLSSGLNSGRNIPYSQCKAGYGFHPQVQLCNLLFSHVQLFAIPWTAARQASLSFTISLSLLKLMSTESVMTSNHLILFSTSPAISLSQASESFLMSWLFESGGQSIASASALVLPLSSQD